MVQKAIPTNLHADLQFWIAQLLFELFGRPRHRIRTEQNLRLSQDVALIPDVCVLNQESREPGFAIGVTSCWILDPESRQAWVIDKCGLQEINAVGNLIAGPISLGLSEVFAV